MGLPRRPTNQGTSVVPSVQITHRYVQLCHTRKNITWYNSQVMRVKRSFSNFPKWLKLRRNTRVERKQSTSYVFTISLYRLFSEWMNCIRSVPLPQTSFPTTRFHIHTSCDRACLPLPPHLLSLLHTKPGQTDCWVPGCVMFSLPNPTSPLCCLAYTYLFVR